MSRPLVFTIGHSTHQWEEFVAMLQSFQVAVLADVRRFPGSRKYPHFNADYLAAHVPEAGIQYQPFPLLGGRRKPNPDSKNTGWRSASFQAYADYMETEEFLSALTDLKALALGKSLAYMCSEAVWWRCHRGLISDKLKSEGWEVRHIMGVGKSEEHPYTSPAVITDGVLSYPPIR